VVGTTVPPSTTDRDTLAIQGYTLAIQGYTLDHTTPPGESVVEIPMDVLKEAMRALGW
jgi:hypothetical protein